jgi:hypothetical protein
VAAPKKFAYHTLSSPMSSGTFLSAGAVAKWRSMARKPARKSVKLLGPMAMASDVPMAESME